MLYFKEFPVSNSTLIIKKLQELIPIDQLQKSSFVQIDVNQVRAISEIWEELCKIGLHPSHCITASFIGVKPNDQVPAHLDAGKSRIGMNWPIINCQKSETHFYTLRNKNTKIVTNIVEPPEDKFLSTYDTAPIENLELQSTVIYNDNPILMRINHWHSITNHDDKMRVTLSLRFLPEIETTYLEQYLQ
jgi:hypothetical protein